MPDGFYGDPAPPGAAPDGFYGDPAPAPAPAPDTAPAKSTGPMPFDIAGARAAGYSDAAIAQYLGQRTGFDFAGARKAGYGDDAIINYLAEQPKPPAPPPPPQSQAGADVNALAQGAPEFVGAAIKGAGQAWDA